MAKTPPSPEADWRVEVAKARNKDPVRVAWSAFIARDLWKVVLAIVVASAVYFTDAIPVQSITLRLGVSESLGVDIVLGNDLQEWKK